MNHSSLLPGNRNSTPETSSSLRPPSQRSQMTSGHHLRSSADMGGITSAAPGSAIRPASEVLYNQHQRGQSHGNQRDMDQASQKWIAEIDQCENTLEEMAAATLDQDFKDELAAIEQWFRVLSEAERTAALYALLQQTTQVQIRFFIGVLQQMAKTHPMSGVLSPSSFSEKDPMAVRLSTAMSKLNVDSTRNSLGPGSRVPLSPGVKRNSGLDQDQISSMFPEAAAAIAQQKKDFTTQTGTVPTSNRNSAAIGDRSSLAAPGLGGPQDQAARDAFTSPLSPSPWGSSRSNDAANRPKSSSGQHQQPMGQFSQPPPSAGLRSSRPAPLSQDSSSHHIPMNPTDSNGMPLLSPYTAGGNWASMVNTPMVPSFNQQGNQADMVANATAMKLAAMSTVNNRVQLDDPRKYRRTRSTEGRNQPPLSAGLPPIGIQNFPMTNELGQILTPQQAATLQAQQLAAMTGRRSRPNSPGITVQGQGMSDMNFAGTQQNGFLSAYNSNTLNNGLGGLSLPPFGGVGGAEGYLSDASEIQRGRSPRGRRGTSRPPEDPTDLQLLEDIPQWLRTLRLHKYTDNLKDLKWIDLVQLDDKGLEDRGVAAVGARRKLLKVFEEVREAQSQGKI